MVLLESITSIAVRLDGAKSVKGAVAVLLLKDGNGVAVFVLCSIDVVVLASEHSLWMCGFVRMHNHVAVLLLLRKRAAVFLVQ